MYCSNHVHKEHCDIVDNIIRTGIPYFTPFGQSYFYPPEQLLYDSGVDIVFEGHEHSYERMWPVYNRKVCNGTDDPNNPYRNAPAPVQLVVGAAVRFYFACFSG